MTERRGEDGRLARLEERTARLDERIHADAAERERWRGETMRRLEDLNHAREELRKNIEKDRQEFVSKEVYESRHRELTAATTAISDKMDQKLSMHERDDLVKHQEEDRRIRELEEARIMPLERWQANMTGRFWALGVGLGLLLSLLTIFLHLVWK